MTLALLFALFGCSGSSDVAPSLPKGDPTRPDVLLVSIDTLRADHLGAWGYGRPTSPFLDELAAGGTRFASAWSPSPWTLPTHATILSGVLPPVHGAIEGDRTIAAGVPWLPEVMAQAGYVTVGVVATWYVGDKYGFSRGFDAFYDFDMASERENLRDSPKAERVFAELTERVQAQPDGKPLFVFAHLYDVHYGYEPPSPWDEKFDRPNRKGDLKYRKYDYYLKNPVPPEQMEHQIAQYDEEIAYTDDRIRAFVHGWRASGRELVVVIVSDHGEEFGERGSWGHAHTLWPEQLHVPWIVSGPGIRAQVVDDRVGLEDVAPTLAGLAGVPYPPTDGTDRSKQLRGEAVATAHVAGQLAETSRFDTLKLRWHQPPYDLQADLAKGSLQLCDLAADPKCTRDVASDRFDDVTVMERAMYAAVGAPFEATTKGTLESTGIFLVYGQRAPKRLVVEPGVRFALLPPDASFTFRDAAGQTFGPWQVLGGTLPGEHDPIRFHGPGVRTEGVTLDAEQKAALEALGYVQD